MSRQQIEFAFLNLGHFFDHLFVLVFATVSALTLATEWGMSYAELIPYATPGFVAFGLFAVPAGWLADKWSRQGMMVVFFIGIGFCAILTSWVTTPIQLGLGLFIIGAFAAIYHPVGLAMVVHNRAKTGHALAVNGVFGNLGVASAALITGFLIDVEGWRAAFAFPGFVSIAAGLAYWIFLQKGRRDNAAGADGEPAGERKPVEVEEMARRTLLRIFGVILFSTAVGGLVFQSTTFALPKVLDERLIDIAGNATVIGWYAFLIFALAALAQLVVGYLVDRHSIRTVFTALAALQCLFFAIMIQVEGLTSVIVAIAFMLTVFGQIPINDVLIGRVTKPAWRSRIFGLRYVVTFSVMASALPFVAWLHAGWGFDVLFQILAWAAAAILLAVLTLPKVAAVVGEG